MKTLCLTRTKQLLFNQPKFWQRSAKLMASTGGNYINSIFITDILAIRTGRYIYVYYYGWCLYTLIWKDMETFVVKENMETKHFRQVILRVINLLNENVPFANSRRCCCCCAIVQATSISIEIGDCDINLILYCDSPYHMIIYWTLCWVLMRVYNKIICFDEKSHEN